MKKRLISILLSVCMLVMLFASLGTTAAAASDRVSGYLVSYTMKAGDTIYSICKDKGIDFDTKYQQILTINGITNPNWMYPGTKLWLPVTSADTSAPYYTLLSHVILTGETPASICQDYGVDYSTNLTLLAALNSNLNNAIVGQTFVLPLYVNPGGSTVTPTPTSGTATPTPTATPASGSSGTMTGSITAVTQSGSIWFVTVNGYRFNCGSTVCTGTPAVGKYAEITYSGLGTNSQWVSAATFYDVVTATPAATSGTVTPTPTASSNIPSGDTLSYYLAAHVMQSGETVSGVCAALGVNFNQYDATIRSLNNITDYSTVKYSQTILIPTTSVPTGSYYKIMAHTVVSGDTVYDLCSRYGLNYYTYSDMIMKLNKTTNLASFYVGQTLYMPIYVNGGSSGTTTLSTTGTITALTGSSITVNGITFNTRGAGLSGTATVGATATVTYTVTSNVYSATYVTIVSATATPSPTATPAAGSSGTMTGSITAVTQSGNIWFVTVNGYKFNIGTTVCTGTPAVGKYAEITYSGLSTNSQWVSAATFYDVVTATPTAVPGTVTPTPTANPNLPSGDTLSYYLAEHVMQAGETVSGVCAALGVDFNSVSAQIQNLSGITNFSYMKVGDKVLIPMKSAPASGSYYKIMAHTVVSGDTVYALCTTYGLNFNNYSAMIMKLNNTTNLASFYVGQTLYMPLYVSNGTGTATATPTSQRSTTGTITALTGSSMTVNGIIFNIRGATVSGSCGVGSTVTVIYTVSNNVYSAVTVTVQGAATPTPTPTATPSSGSSGTMTGSITAVSLSGSIYYVTVNGYTFNIGTTVCTGTPAVGKYAEIKYSGLGTNSQWVSAATFYEVVTATPASATATPASSSVPSGDTLSYYVKAYTIQYGDTVSAVCANLGVNFDSVSSQIMQLSGITSFTNLLPGQVIMIPMYSVPTAPYYKVMAHTLVAGDTIYNLCLSYGLNYTNNLVFIQRLNNTTNLSNFYVGQTVYMPLYVQS